MFKKYDGSMNPFGDYNENGRFDAQDELIFETYFGDQSEEEEFEDYSEKEDWEDEDDDFKEDWEEEDDDSLENEGWEWIEDDNDVDALDYKIDSSDIEEIWDEQRELYRKYANLVLEVNPNDKTKIRNWEELLFCAYGLMIKSWNRPLTDIQYNAILACYDKKIMSCSHEKFKRVLLMEKGENLPSVESITKKILELIDEANGKNHRRMEVLAWKICYSYESLQETFANCIFESAPDDAGEEFAKKLRESIEKYFDDIG
ncbi:hypothetical protein LI177_05120 [bacterium 210820-DFI.6.37]|nr:hypothetical protein [bacterium 210820-DFI.6.37]